MKKVEDQYYYQLIHTLAVILDRDGDQKLNHGLRTAVIAARLAQRIEPEIAGVIFYAGLLHDVGGVGLPDSVIHYALKDKWDKPEVRKHSSLGAEIIGQLPGLEKAKKYIDQHHERWDGTGFPLGLTGETIELGSQLLLLADQIDIKIRLTGGNRTAIYNFLRREQGKMYNPDLWVEILELLGTSNNSFFYRLIDEYQLYHLADELEKSIPSLQINHSGDDFIFQAIKVFGQAIDTKHPYTQGHSHRVAEYSAVLARHIGLADEIVRDIRLAGYLHDLGKLTIPLSILDKKSSLTADEYEKIKSHVLITRELLDYQPLLRPLAPIAGTHHEKWNGQGYPDKLTEEEIPIGGRIMALADSLDALTSKRSYNTPLTLEDGAARLFKVRGEHFDPEIVDLLKDESVLEDLRSFKEV